jgi:hypothetical protein
LKIEESIFPDDLGGLFNVTFDKTRFQVFRLRWIRFQKGKTGELTPESALAEHLTPKTYKKRHRNQAAMDRRSSS